MKMEAMDVKVKEGNLHDESYMNYVSGLKTKLEMRVELYGPHLFTTDAKDIWKVYLETLPDETRQYHNCHTCKKFMEKYGSLVFVDEFGHLIPAFWVNAHAPEDERTAVFEIESLVRSSNITGAYISDSHIWGVPITGVWRHFSFQIPKALWHTDKLKSPEQIMAEIKQDAISLFKVIKNYPVEPIETMQNIIDTGAIPLSEIISGPVTWLYQVHKSIEGKHKDDAKNILWKAAATAPPGFCHFQNTVGAKLIRDLINGLDFGIALERHLDKVDPARYQRPVARPENKQIEQAEKVIEKLGVQSSLQRRYASADEVRKLWLPYDSGEPVDPEPTSIFSHIKTKVNVIEIPDKPLAQKHVTWRYFNENVLPNTVNMLYRVPAVSTFAAIVTAVHLDAPPILQWDHETVRNPFSLYTYTQPSFAEKWQLTKYDMVKVLGVCRRPEHWQEGYNHFVDGALFILDGAKDMSSTMCLFPVILKKEFKEISSVIEAYSEATALAQIEEQQASGILLSKNNTANPWGHIFLVELDTGLKMQYFIDGWE